MPGRADVRPARRFRAAREGATRRLPRVIGFHRTGAGDYRSVRADPATVVLEPATRPRLAADLDGLLAYAH